ncbi:MAG TPA: DUF2585 domain-containing protein [Allosphingosinicella sp.]
MNAPPIPRAYWIAVLAVLAATASIELAMGRPPICTCGTVRLWIGAVRSAENSQQIADWYSLSHIIHGFLFYWIGWLVLKRNPPGDRLLAAILIEAGWELLENSPIVITRYRHATAALGYSGDSILNSVSDICFMLLGFALARRLPVWATIMLAIAFELLALAMIRDNLTLNVLMLVAPNDAIRAWQSGV